jgi:hypothetical protein
MVSVATASKILARKRRGKILETKRKHVGLLNLTQDIGQLTRYINTKSTLKKASGPVIK